MAPSDNVAVASDEIFAAIGGIEPLWLIEEHVEDSICQASGQIPLWISQRKIPCESRLFVNSGRKCSASGCAMLCMPNWPILKTEQDDLHQRDGLRTPFTELVQQGFLTGFSSLQICLNVLDVPTSGCPEGHTYCRECFRKVMQKQRRCPACRHPLSEAQLQRNRPLEGMIARLRLRCKHAEHEGDDKVAASAPGEVPGHKPCAEVTADELRSELRAGGLDPSGRPELAVSRPPPPLPPSAGAEYEHRRMGERRRVECSQSTVWAWQARVEGLRDTAGCGWRGVVGELTAHLRSDCQFEPVPCPNTGCTETRARRRIAEHADGLCPFRLVACRFCAGAFVQKTLSEHEDECPQSVTACPNEGCGQVITRAELQAHRDACSMEQVTCPCAGCFVKMQRRELDQHIEGSMAMHLRFALEAMVQHEAQQSDLKAERSALVARVQELEARVALPPPMVRMFTWRIVSWDRETVSEKAALDVNGELTSRERAHCSLKPLAAAASAVRGATHEMAVVLSSSLARCKIHATFCIEGEGGRPPRRLCEIGSAGDPCALTSRGGKAVKTVRFTLTPADCRQLRTHSSVVLRAVVALHVHRGDVPPHKERQGASDAQVTAAHHSERRGSGSRGVRTAAASRSDRTIAAATSAGARSAERASADSRSRRALRESSWPLSDDASDAGPTVAVTSTLGRRRRRDDSDPMAGLRRDFLGEEDEEEDDDEEDDDDEEEQGSDDSASYRAWRRRRLQEGNRRGSSDSGEGEDANRRGSSDSGEGEDATEVDLYHQFASWMEMAASWRWPRVGGHLRDSAMRGGRNRGRGGRPVSESDEEDAVYGSRANDLTAHSTDSSDLDD